MKCFLLGSLSVGTSVTQEGFWKKCLIDFCHFRQSVWVQLPVKYKKKKEKKENTHTESDGLATVQTLPANIKIEMGAEVLPVPSKKALNTFETKKRRLT